MAAGKSTAADLGAHVCFQDEAGQALSPPRARTWSLRGRRPVVQVRARGRGRVNIAGVCCCRPGHRTRFLYRLHVYHGRRKEPKSFAGQDYRDLIAATHQVLGTPIIWCWDNLNVHLQQELFDDAEENRDRLRVYHLPRYTPDLNPAEGVWPLPKRSIGSFVVADLAGLTRLVKYRLTKIQYRPDLIDGCLTGTGPHQKSIRSQQPAPPRIQLEHTQGIVRWLAWSSGGVGPSRGSALP